VEDPTVEGLSTVVSHSMRIDVVFSTGTGHSANTDI
jgi:RNA-binding protein YlmH